MAEYCGSPHAVALDTCTAAVFLCLKLLRPRRVSLPRHTYLGIACTVVHSGAELILHDLPWRGAYSLEGTDIVDSACRLHRGMYRPGTLTCLSFQYRKHLKIGRGGMVLTDSCTYRDWLRAARFCGRTAPNGAPEFVGWHAYMEPERAARGLVLMDSLPDCNSDLEFCYPDLNYYEVLR